MTRPSRGKVVRAAFAVLTIGGLAYATVKQWSRVADTVAQVNATELAVAVLAMLAGTFLSMMSWRAILAGLGSPLRLRDAIGIFFVGQLGKYLPGSVWAVVAQAELGRKHDVPRKQGAVSVLLAMLVGLTAGGIVAAATLPFAAGGELEPYRYAFLLPALGLVLLVPRVFEVVSARALRLLRREPLERGLSPRGIAAAMAWALLQWAVWGLAVSSLADGAPYALCAGAYALAWSAGLLVILAPAGAGVRETAVVVLLGSAIGNVPAFGVALVLRMLSTVADVLWGLVALAFAGHARFVRVTPE